MEDEATTLAEALPRYFRAAGLPEDGGHASRWVWFRLAGISLCFPNFGARRRVVRYHDLHHLLTGYRTDWTGELLIDMGGPKSQSVFNAILTQEFAQE